jgi:hypothetical protein
MISSPGVDNKLSDLFVPIATTNGRTAVVVEPAMSWSRAQQQAQYHWFAAVAALETLLLHQNIGQGLCICGPMPVLSHPDLLSRCPSVVLTPLAGLPLARLPATPLATTRAKPHFSLVQEVFLSPQDPLAQEQFCLVLTEHFGLLMLVGEDTQGQPQFHFSFNPEKLLAALSRLQARLPLSGLPAWLTDWQAPVPDYQLVTDFSHYLLRYLAPIHLAPPPPIPAPQGPPSAPSVDVELIQALTHEIRTPLTSIRTMTRLLLKRRDLPADIKQRVQAIDRECTEQIGRMELIFRATELATSPRKEPLSLVPTSLEQLFQQCIPRWQHQAQRHGVALAVDLPSTLPQVASNPILLDQVLTGLIEKFVRSLASGGAIQLQVGTAGDQLKLQFHIQASYEVNPLKALGELLLFQPETGRLSLNLDVTKNLFQALGAKLTIRRRSSQEEILTLYLPLG